MTNDADIFHGRFRGSNTSRVTGSEELDEDGKESTGSPAIQSFLEDEFRMYFTMSSDVALFIQVLESDGIVRPLEVCLSFLQRRVAILSCLFF